MRSDRAGVRVHRTDPSVRASGASGYLVDGSGRSVKDEAYLFSADELADLTLRVTAAARQRRALKLRWTGWLWASLGAAVGLFLGSTWSYLWRSAHGIPHLLYQIDVMCMSFIFTHLCVGYGVKRKKRFWGRTVSVAPVGRWQRLGVFALHWRGDRHALLVGEEGVTWRSSALHNAAFTDYGSIVVLRVLERAWGQQLLYGSLVWGDTSVDGCEDRVKTQEVLRSGQEVLGDVRLVGVCDLLEEAGDAVSGAVLLVEDWVRCAPMEQALLVALDGLLWLGRMARDLDEHELVMLSEFSRRFIERWASSGGTYRPLGPREGDRDWRGELQGLEAVLWRQIEAG